MTTAKQSRLVSIPKSDLDSLEATIETLENAIIVYVGDLGKFVKEYVAPSVFFIRVVGVAV